MAKNVSVVLEPFKMKPVNRKVERFYSPSRLLEFKRGGDFDLKESEALFTLAQKDLRSVSFAEATFTMRMLMIAAMTIGGVKFDLDTKTKELMKIVDESGLRFGIKEFDKLIPKTKQDKR